MRRLRPAEDDWKAIQRRARLRYALRALGIALLSVVACWLVATKGVVPTRSDIDARKLLEPKRPGPFQPPYPIDTAVLSQIDMAKVHGTLLPAWIMTLQHGQHARGRWDRERAFLALRGEAGRDANLAVLLDRLHDRLLAGAYETGGELRSLVKGWNDYMSRGGVPFRIEYHIEKRAHGPEIRIRTYRALADVAVQIAHTPYRVLVLSREDRTNLVEGFLGQTSADRDAALVVTDRVVDFAIGRLWPVFDADGELMPSDTDPALIAKLRTEALLVLGAPAVGRLASSSALHREIEAEIAKLKQRRGCGASVLVPGVPWDGLSERTLSMIDTVAKKNEAQRCPRLTVSDAERLVTMSRRLRDDPALADALGRLASWLARAVAVHEARHLADDRADADRISCPGCPTSMAYPVRAEVSAYLASFAAEGLGQVALLQACGVDPERKEAHSAALGYLLPKLLSDGCAGAMPDDWYERARALERELFGREETVALPLQFPEALPVRRE